jgi:hypothetical protein
MAYHPTILSGFRLVQTDIGDSRLVNYLLEHGFRWLMREPPHLLFWSPPFFYPATGVAAYSDILLGVAPFYWAWRWLGFAPDTAFQLWMATLLSLNYLMAHLLLRRGFGFGALASAAGAFLFAFGASRVNQMHHQQLLAQFFALGSVYALAKLLAAAGTLERARAAVPWMAVLGSGLAAQFYAGYYFGWYWSFAIGLAALVALGFASTRDAVFLLVRRRPAMLLATLGLAGVSLYPMAAPYLVAARQVGLRSFHDVGPMLPRPASWFHVGHDHWLYGWTHTSPPFQMLPFEWEHRLGFGYLTPVLAFVFLVREWRRPWVRVLLCTSAILVLLTTVFGDFSAWQWIFAYAPGASAIRALSRVGTLLLLPAAVGLAFFVRWGLETEPPASPVGSLPAGVRAPIGVLLLAGVVLEQGMTPESFDKRINRADIRLVARHLEPHCESFVYSPVRPAQKWEKYAIDAMWAGLEARVPTLNGYSGQWPPGWRLMDLGLRNDADTAAVDETILDWLRMRGLEPDAVCRVRAEVRDGPDAGFVSQSVPTSMIGGKRYDVLVRLKNRGRQTWNERELFRLGGLADAERTWGTARVYLPSAIPPGVEATFRFKVVAPSVPGTYVFQWQMVQEGMRWFGESSTRVNVEVRVP